jgi:Uma2 family endonuclease
VEPVKSPAEGRVLLRNVSWETYERLIDEREERSVPRFFYDRGELEIVSPSFEHDRISRIVALLVELVAAEIGLDLESAGSTTFKSGAFKQGFEPDECFYFSGNAEGVRGKKNIDLDAGDPPPDLVVEVDLTNPSLSKLPIYAHLGVAEVWRLPGGKPEILVPASSGAGYEASERSRALPLLTNDALSRLVEEGLTTRRPDWARQVREWARREMDQSPKGG